MVQGSSGDGVCCLVHTFADVDIAACAYLRGRRRDELRIQGGANLCCHSCLRCSCVKGRARGEIVVRCSYEHREGGAPLDQLRHLSSQLPSVPSLLNGKFGGGSMFFRERRWWLNHAAVENNKSTFDTIQMTKLVTEPAAPHVGAGVRPNNRGDLSPFAARKKACF